MFVQCFVERCHCLLPEHLYGLSRFVACLDIRVDRTLIHAALRRRLILHLSIARCVDMLHDTIRPPRRPGAQGGESERGQYPNLYYSRK